MQDSLGLLRVLLFSPDVIHAETNRLDLSSEILADRIECHSHCRFNSHFKFFGIIVKYQTEGSVLVVSAPTVSFPDLRGNCAVFN